MENRMQNLIEVDPFTTTVPKLENITEKYKFISTAQFINDVQSLGYKLETTQRPRRGLGMHSMSFSHPSMPKIEGLDMRLLATNSHDATSAFRLYIQMFVQVCSNGLVAWQNQGIQRVVHRGYAVDKVAEAIEVVRGRFDGVLNQVRELQNTNATPENTATFLRQAAELRDAKPYNLFDLQYARHSEQSENTAWNVFNRVQESLIRGGYATIETVPNQDIMGNILGYKTIPGRAARELNAIKEKVNVNTKLWESAVKTLLKAA